MAAEARASKHALPETCCNSWRGMCLASGSMRSNSRKPCALSAHWCRCLQESELYRENEELIKHLIKQGREEDAEVWHSALTLMVARQCGSAYDQDRKCRKHYLLGASGKTMSAVVSKGHLTRLLLPFQLYAA